MERELQAFIEAKATEEAAKQARVKAEQALLKAFNPSRLEGTEHKACGQFQVTVVNKLNRTLDIEKYREIVDMLPEHLQFVRFKPDIELKTLRLAEAYNSDLIAQCVTTKPAKAAIEIREL